MYANAEKGTHGERIYTELIDDGDFQERLQNDPQLEDFEKVRNFVVHFGVRFIPKEFATTHLLPVWPMIKPHIGALAGETLETVDFGSEVVRNAIIGAYDWPSWVWGRATVKSKVLHFFNVRLFVMWDDVISRPYGGDAEGYLEFLQAMQIQAKEAIANFKILYPSSSIEAFLSEKIGYSTPRPLTKLIDQFNWITSTKSWPDSLPHWLMDLSTKQT